MKKETTERLTRPGSKRDPEVFGIASRLNAVSMVDWGDRQATGRLFVSPSRPRARKCVITGLTFLTLKIWPETCLPAALKDTFLTM